MNTTQVDPRWTKTMHAVIALQELRAAETEHEDIMKRNAAIDELLEHAGNILNTLETE